MTIKTEVVSFEHMIKDYQIVSSAVWARRSDQPGQNPKEVRVVVNPDQAFQQFQGMGAAFSEIGGKALFSLGEDDRETLLKKCFHKDEGAGFTNCRLPIGSSDFALSAYSLNDYADDYAMEHFSLKRDFDYLIPFIKGAYRYAEELKIHASPWSPPAWLKTNNDFVGGGSLMDNDKTYKAYALYLAKYITAYAEQGIHINKLLIQNEPDSAAGFPSCVMEPSQMVKFAVDYLDDALRKQNLTTQIWGGTFRTVTGLQAQQCMKSKKFRQVIGGLGFQYALVDSIYDLLKIYPDTQVMHTESVCYNGDNSWEQAVSLFNDFVDYMQAGCTIYSYWNMILDGTGRSTWGWKQNALVTIHDQDHIVYNPDYYVMALLSKHIRPGASRIECLCLAKRAIAFKNPDGSVVVFMCNLNDRGIHTTMELYGNEHTFELPASSIVAVRIESDK